MRIDDIPLERRTAAWGLAAALAILFNTALTAVKEIFAPVRSVMTMTMGHHWVAQGVVVLVIYALLGLLFSRMRIAERIPPMRLVALLIAATVVAGLGLLGMFAWMTPW